VRKVLKTAKTKNGNFIELVTPGEVSDNNVLIIGVFHGDEPQGKYLIERYLEDKNSSITYEESPLSQTLSHKGRGLNELVLDNAKKLRSNMTDAEKILWEILRAKRFYGLKFRRQVPIGKYIVDFVCFSENLVVELDGGQHNEEPNKEYDKTRAAFLGKEGFRVIRIWNDEIFNNIEGVCEYIINSLSPCGRGQGRWGNKLFIPCLNPDGMAQGSRVNANGVDLNRNFPTKNWGEDGSSAGNDPSAYFGGKAPASEIETQFVIDIIEEYRPKLILTLHAPYKVVNYDGPAQEIAEKISEIIKYPVEASIGYPTPGSFGTYCGVERSIPTITLELDEEIPVEELVQPVFEIFDLF